MGDLKTMTENIRLIRQIKGIKVETMAKQLGISKGEYSKIENNNRKNIDKHLLKISEILATDLDLLSQPFETYYKVVNKTK